MHLAILVTLKMNDTFSRLLSIQYLKTILGALECLYSNFYKATIKQLNCDIIDDEIVYYDQIHT